MSIPTGTYKLGPGNGTLSVRTGRVGAAAKAGHDLLLHVTVWQATLEVGEDPDRHRARRRCHLASRARGHRRDAGARRRGQGEHRADDRRRGPEAPGHRVPLDRGAGRRRRAARRPGRADAGRARPGRSLSTSRVDEDGRLTRQRRPHAERLGNDALLGAVRSPAGRRRGRGRDRRRPAVDRRGLDVDPRAQAPRAEAGAAGARRDLARVDRGPAPALRGLREQAERDPPQARDGRPRRREPGLLGGADAEGRALVRDRRDQEPRALLRAPRR